MKRITAALFLVAIISCNSIKFPENVQDALVKEGFTGITYQQISEDIYHFEVGYPEITNSERNHNRLFTDNKYAKRSYTGTMIVGKSYFMTTDNRLLGKPKWEAIVRALNKHLN